jgi:phage major head subunit gpT-like protein
MPADLFDDRNIIGLFHSGYEQRFEGSWAGRLSFYNDASTSETEKYGLLGGYPKMREWVGARQVRSGFERKQYEIRNKPYETGLDIPVPLLRRDKSGLLEAHMNGFAEGVVANHWEDLLIDLINANGECYDGAAYFATTHEWGDSGVQANIITSSDYGDPNVGTPTAPTALEMGDVILVMLGHLMLVKDSAARYVNGTAKKFVIVVSTVKLFAAALKAVSSAVLASGVDNPVNGLKMSDFTFEVKLIPALTSATQKVRMFREDGILKPFILQQEKDIQLEILGEGSDYKTFNNAYYLGVNSSRGAGYGLWEHALEAQLS